MQRVIRRVKGISVNIQDYQEKRDLFFNALSEMGYELTKPMGAFYLFPKSPVEDELEFVKMLQSKNILTVPGRGFGRSGYFRISYCVPLEVIKRSLDGFKEAIKEV
jgi:aspartate aminotransferase